MFAWWNPLRHATASNESNFFSNFTLFLTVSTLQRSKAQERGCCEVPILKIRQLGIFDKVITAIITNYWSMVFNVSICFKGREVGQRFIGPQTLLFFTQKMMMILWRPRKKTSSTSSSGGSSWSVVRPRPLFAAALLSDALHTTFTIFEKVNGGRRRLEEEEDEERRRPRRGSKALKSKVTLWTRDLLLFSYTDLGSLIGNTQCGNFRIFTTLRFYV